MEKHETSVAYLLPNQYLLEEVYLAWGQFQNILQQGPEAMKEKLASDWNTVKTWLKASDEIILLDEERAVTKDDFNATMALSKNEIRVFFLHFPSSDFYRAESRAIAIALTPERPRYFTMEYALYENSKSFVFGEFIYNIYTGERVHRNYGFLEEPTVEYFAGAVLSVLEHEYDDKLVEQEEVA